jgi:dipicolinate synthase subunit A
MSLSIIGGDLRIIRLAQMYANEGKTVYVYGLEKYFKKYNIIDNNIIMCKNIEEIINLSKYILSSIPCLSDSKYINSPYTDEKIEFNQVIEKINKTNDEKYFIAGKIPKNLNNEKIHFIDLLENEEFNILNSIPTVEGTLKILIQEREETIHESNILVCGYGRIGKILCDRLKKLGANVFCSARKEYDFAWIREKGYIPLKYEEIKEYGKRLDVIINTVPEVIIDKEKLDSLYKDILIIDLASNPGGIDKEYAKKKNIRVITALGIPGKEMPQAAGRYIKEIIDKLIKEN